MTEHDHDIWIEKITRALRTLRQETRQDGDTTANRSPRSSSDEGGRRDAHR